MAVVKKLAIVLLMSVVFLSGCISQPQPTAPTTTTIKKITVTTLPPAPVETLPPKTVEEYKAAVTSSDSDKCKDMEPVDVRDQCYFNIGKNTNDVSLCKKVSDPTNKDICISKVALQLKDKSLCSQIETTRLIERCNTSF